MAFYINPITNIYSVLNLLDNPPEGLKFYPSGSRAVAKRIGTDKLTQAQLDEATHYRFNQLLTDKKIKRINPELATALQWLSGQWVSGGRSPVLITDATDYDYYCMSDAAHVQYLEKLGFVSSDYQSAGLYHPDTPSDSYCDDLCTQVYKHPEFNVEVVTRPDPVLYQAIFDNIPLHIYYQYLWKSSPTKPDRDAIKHWFNTFITIAKAVQELK